MPAESRPGCSSKLPGENQFRTNVAVLIRHSSQVADWISFDELVAGCQLPVNYLSRSAECLFNWSFMSTAQSVAGFLQSRVETLDGSEDNREKIGVVLEDVEMMHLTGACSQLVMFLQQRFLGLKCVLDKLGAVKSSLPEPLSESGTEVSLDVLTDFLLMRNRLLFLLTGAELRQILAGMDDDDYGGQIGRDLDPISAKRRLLDRICRLVVQDCRGQRLAGLQRFVADLLSAMGAVLGQLDAPHEESYGLSGLRH